MKNIWMAIATLLVANLAQAAGNLQVAGEAGKFQIFQKVKAVRCSFSKRGACDAPVFFGLNTPQAVAAGSYLVGFENSIYPEIVSVEEGRTTTIYLEKVSVPAQIKGQKIRVYRDFSASIEQRKIFMTMFMMNRHFFRLEKENFGDLYLTGVWDRDFVQRFTYETCANITWYEASSAAKQVCAAWNSAQIPEDLRPLYEFNNDGTFQENWVTPPGDSIPSDHPRYLVSTPMTDQDFVGVFPGVYKIQAEGKAAAISVRAGNSN